MLFFIPTQRNEIAHEHGISSLHRRPNRSSKQIFGTISVLFFMTNRLLGEKYLAWAEFHYDTSVYTKTGISPFQVVYEKPPSTILSYIQGTSNNEAVDPTLTTRDDILQNLRKKFLKAQQQMKAIADKRSNSYKF